MGAVGKRIDPTETQILEAISEALASGAVPDDNYWTTRELSEMTNTRKDLIVDIVRDLMISGAWERTVVVRVSPLDGRRCRVTGYRPKETEPA